MSLNEMRQILEVYNFKKPYRRSRCLDAETMSFIDKYKLRDFFLSILVNYDVNQHRANSESFFQQQLQGWNKEHHCQLVEEEFLSKLYILKSNGRVLVNPYIDFRVIAITEELAFLQCYDKFEYYYPFFDTKFLVDLLKVHNDKFKVELQIEALTDKNQSVYHSIFANYKGLRSIFNEALTSYLASITFTEWENNIGKFANILTEISFCQVLDGSTIDLLESNKRLILVTYLKNFLTQNVDICIFEDLNYLSRLQYVQYEIKGFDIENPTPESRLIPYSKNRYQKTNIFDRYDVASHFYQSFENRRIFTALIKEVDFCFGFLREYIFSNDWCDILKGCNSFYYRFNLTLYYNNDLAFLIDSKSLVIAPSVVYALLTLPVYNQLSEYGFNGENFKKAFLSNYVKEIYDRSVDSFYFLSDLYFYLLREESSPKTDPQFREIIDQLLSYIVEFIGSNGLPSDFIQRYLQIENTIDLIKMKVITQVGDPIYFAFVIEAYTKIVKENDLFENFFRLKGKENLFVSLSYLSPEGLEKFLNTFDFLDTEDVSYKHGRRVRFHLGILCLYARQETKGDLKQIVKDYIFKYYSQIKRGAQTSYAPLAWDNISFDTISIGNSTLDINEFLTYQLISILKEEKEETVREFFNLIIANLSVIEMVLFKDAFPDVKEISDIKIDSFFQSQFERISFGLAEKDAYILIRFGFPNFGLQYISYIEKSRKNINDQLLLLKLEALIAVERYQEAMNILDALTDKRKNDSFKGLILFLEKKHTEADVFFKRYFKTNRPDCFDVVNYSANLIKMNKHDDAIKILEKHRGVYNDPLIYLNLGIAYSNSDNLKSLSNILIAKRLEPNISSVNKQLIESLKGFIPEYVNEIIGNTALNADTDGIITDLVNLGQDYIKRLFQTKIDSDEQKIVYEIYNAIESKVYNPKRLKELSETGLSDDLKGIIQAGLRNDKILVERECPRGFAAEKIGEIDFFIFRNEPVHEILATGENKEWGGEEQFRKQLKQLMGYMQENRGFGFTILFSKNKNFLEVLQRRKEVLNTFYVDDGDKKYFEICGPIYDATHIIPKLRDVIITMHRNPEKPDSYMRLYHFTINANLNERELAAKQARPDKK